jgi:molybdopterin-biosynthesis enzyme MoeA-like protein
VHFVPGFPNMAWPMVAWVLGTQYRALFSEHPDVEQGCIAIEAREGDLITLMQEFVARYPALRFSSLPNFGTDAIPQMHIEFGFSGQPALVAMALDEWRKALLAKGYEVRDKPAS